MDRNSIIGIVLIIGIIIGFSILNAPSDEQIAREKAMRDSVANARKEARLRDSLAFVKQSRSDKENAALIVAKDSTLAGLPDEVRKAKEDSVIRAQNSNLYGPFAAAAEPLNEQITLSNELMEVTLSNKGGIIREVRLKNFKNYHNKDTLILFDSKTSGYGIPLSVNNRLLRTDSLYFKSTGKTETGVQMQLTAGNDRFIEYSYSLTPGSYMIGFSIRMKGMNTVIDQGALVDFEWRSSVFSQEKDAEIERTKSGIYYRDNAGDVTSVGLGSDEKEEIDFAVKWVGFSQQFFTSTLIADQEFKGPVSVNTEMGQEGSEIIRKFNASIRLPFEGGTDEKYTMQWYMGPKDYKILAAYDLGLEKQINLGWSIFRFVNTLLIINIFQFLDSYHLGYGLIILILTIIVRLILSPVTFRTYVSSAKMRILKPEIDEINEKLKDADPLKKQQEIMGLYRRAGVNPLAGCIPALLQMPILFAIFNFFPSSIELRQQAFLWADDLSSWDSIYTLPFAIPFYGDHVSLFTILMTVSTMIYTSLTTTNMGSGAQAQQMKIMMYVMPIIFLGVLNNYSAALSYYYLLANTASILQTLFIRKFMIDENKLRAQMEENKKKPSAQKKSKWAQRLEEMQKLQRQRSEELSKKKKK